MPFCTKCGKELKDGEVCSCTQSESENKVEVQVAEVKQTLEKAAEAGKEKLENLVDAGKDLIVSVREDPKKHRTPLIIAGAVVAALIVALVVGLIVGGNAYKEPINRLVNEINKGEKAGYVELFTAYGTDSYRKTAKDVVTLLRKSMLEQQNEYIEEAFEDLRGQYENWKVSFEIASTDKLSDNDLDDYEDELEDLWDNRFEDIVDEIKDLDNDELDSMMDQYDVEKNDLQKALKQFEKYAKSFEKIKVTDGYKVKGRFILKNGRDEVDKTNKVTLYVLKINGSWAVYYSKNGDTFRFEKTDSKHYGEYRFLENYFDCYFKYNNSIGF